MRTYQCLFAIDLNTHYYHQTGSKLAPHSVCKIAMPASGMWKRAKKLAREVYRVALSNLLVRRPYDSTAFRKLGMIMYSRQRCLVRAICYVVCHKHCHYPGLLYMRDGNYGEALRLLEQSTRLDKSGGKGGIVWRKILQCHLDLW